MWELRAACDLAGLWRDQGRGAEAHGLLAPIYSWFSEGFGTRELQMARAVLDATLHSSLRDPPRENTPVS
jgi:predicted ATPase